MSQAAQPLTEERYLEILKEYESRIDSEAAEELGVSDLGEYADQYWSFTEESERTEEGFRDYLDQLP